MYTCSKICVCLGVKGPAGYTLLSCRSHIDLPVKHIDIKIALLFYLFDPLCSRLQYLGSLLTMTMDMSAQLPREQHDSVRLATVSQSTTMVQAQMYSTTIWWIAMKFHTNIYGPQRMNGHLTTWVKCLEVSEDCREIRFRHSRSPQVGL